MAQLFCLPRTGDHARKAIQSEQKNFSQTPLPLQPFQMHFLVVAGLLTCEHAWFAYGREITFPPVAAISAFQTPLGAGQDIDISDGSEFSGLTTFANLPYVNCFVDQSDTERYDIAFLGAPFDTVSASDRSILEAVVLCRKTFKEINFSKSVSLRLLFLERDLPYLSATCFVSCTLLRHDN